MKKIVILLISVISIIGCFLSISGFAAELQINGQISPDGEITISGLNANPGYVTVEVIRGKAAAVIEAYPERDIKNSVLVDVAKADNQGEFTLKVKLPIADKDKPSDERYYTIILGNTDAYTDVANRSIELYYAIDTEITTAVEDITDAIDASSAEELKKAIENNAEIIQISNELKNSVYVKHSASVIECVLAQGKKQQFTEIKEIQNAFNLAMGVTALNTADAQSFPSVVQVYGEELKLSTVKYYSNPELALAMNASAASVIKEFGLKLPEDAPKAFKAVEAVALLNISSRGKIISILEEYKDIFNIDTTDLTQEKADYIAGKICVADTEKAYTAVKEIFDAYQVAFKGYTTQSGSSSGSGGGGGGAVGGISGGGTGGGAPSVSGPVIVDAQTTDKTEEKKLQFTDLSNVQWAVEYIEALAKAGIVNGKAEGIFDPDAAVTREEFTKMLVLAMELPEASQTADFADVTEEDWFAPYINSATEAGLLKGYDDGFFGVGYNISREEAAALVARAIEYAKYQVEIPAELTYTDTLDISEFAIEYVKICHGAGIVQGNDQNQFLPQNSITRAESAKMIYCLMSLL